VKSKMPASRAICSMASEAIVFEVTSPSSAW
jgi:hypothetical protein